MSLPDSYTLKPGSIPAYFEAMLNAEAPERFTTRFLESLEFKSTNDRLFINVIRELGFIDTDGIPKDRYYQFLDRSQSARIVAEGIKEAYSDLFAVNINAQELSTEEAKNKLRTLYKGAKKDNVIGRIASTFTALCEYGDFSATTKPASEGKTVPEVTKQKTKDVTANESSESKAKETRESKLSLGSLQYHINIVLPESRDQAVYDAIFKSLRDHLGGN
jgi:hypothetical protein